MLIGPQYGIDGGLVNLDKGIYAFTSDPITFTSSENAYYLFAVNINDIIAMGAKPQYLALNILFREGVEEKEVVETFRKIGELAKSFGVCVVTGHTEVTPGLFQTILSGFMAGKVIQKVDPRNIQIGDVIFQVKGVAIEGTSIIAREKEAELKGKFGTDFVEKCKNFLYEPGICLYPMAIEILENFKVHGLHDPTEGGILTAIYEVLKASGKGGEIWEEEIVVYHETRVLSEYFGINPLGLISSGSLLVFQEEREGVRMCKYLNKKGIPCKIIGRVLEEEKGMWVLKGGKRSELKPFERDQILEVL